MDDVSRYRGDDGVMMGQSSEVYCREGVWLSWNLHFSVDSKLINWVNLRVGVRVI